MLYLWYTIIKGKAKSQKKERGKDYEHEREDKNVAWYNSNRCVVRGYVCSGSMAYLSEILREGKEL